MLCLVDGKYPHINPKPHQNAPMWIFILAGVEKVEKHDCGAVSVSENKNYRLVPAIQGGHQNSASKAQLCEEM